LLSRRAENTTLTSRVSQLESSNRQLHYLIKELKDERDMQSSKADMLDMQLTEAKQLLASAEQTAAVNRQLLQQEMDGALAAAQQQLKDNMASMQQELAAAHQAAASNREQAAAATAEREAALVVALDEARAVAHAQQATAAEHEQRQRRTMQRLQEQIKQLEAEKQVGCSV
jgi:chromosome segregation ATPase